MPAQTTTNGGQMMPPQRSSGSGGDEEPISDIDEDEMEEENIDVGDMDDDITPNGGLRKNDVLVSWYSAMHFCCCLKLTRDN